MRNRYFIVGRAPELAFCAVLFTVGLISAIYGWRYGLGQLNDIGPGAFPMGLGIALMILSALSIREAGHDDPLLRRFTPLAFYLPGAILWAVLIQGAGLLIATTALIACCALAEERLNMVRALIFALVLTLAGYLVFILGFGLTFNLIGDWL